MIEAHSARLAVLEPPQTLSDHQERIVFHPPIAVRFTAKATSHKITESRQADMNEPADEPMEYGLLDEGIYARAGYEDGE